MKVIKAKDRFHLESDWLSAYWLFSFDRYYDPNNLNFGPLRVFNHDTIAGGGGFPTHPHREMEIVTYVLDGELAHKDSTGGRGIIHASEVQRMTAGTGIAHSELNASETKPIKLLQMWVLPERSGLTPSYEQKQFTTEQRTGRLLPIAAGGDSVEAVKIHQDVTFYVSRLRAGDEITHELKPGRLAFFYVIEGGGVTLKGETLSAGDQARIAESGALTLSASAMSEIILIDLPAGRAFSE
ncbi:MAG TPA: pirin family protein [Blastocatellia bacterium]|nr:pirin family protein [Blastocatellia bacterium]HMX26723.1 pirin family protein [Blastocatellia bacterium]HMY73831.1 pirin family protein [Blastocatellia bacterium]HMZ19905.1 pirin family protein [Blastocatellia bacterium]HNG31228.1 pirin family protein [Blastocatellia bacterium]